MNYREKLRKAIECPQFGNINYGEYGSLRLDQRKNIKRLLDEMDRADEVIKHQFFEIERLNKRFTAIKDYLKQIREDNKKGTLSSYNLVEDNITRLCDGLDILGSDKE